MPYDPKRLSTNRTPPPLKPAPRGDAPPASPVAAQRDGHCVQCGLPYAGGDDIIVHTAATPMAGPVPQADGYHPRCWKAIYGPASVQRAAASRPRVRRTV